MISMVIYMVRHGQTDWNKQRVMQGLTDVPLNETGIRQALDAKEKLKSVNFDICFSSPLKRAKKTAEIITYNKCKIIEDDLLLERFMGELEKKPYDLYKSIGYWDYELNSNEHKVESIKGLFERAKKFLDKIKNKYGDKTILVVSHGALIRALHYVIVGYDSNTDFLKFNVKNAEVYKYEVK